MIDPLSTTATAVGLAKTATEGFKHLVKIAKASKDSELREQVIDLQGQFMEMNSLLMSSSTRIHELEEELRELQTLGELVPNDDCYWRQVEGGWDGPLCTACADARKQNVRMTYLDGPSSVRPAALCPECKFLTQVGHRPSPPR